METLLAFSTNIKLGWKWLAMANTLAFYNTATITTIKSSMLEFTTVYDNNFRSIIDTIF